MVAGGRHDAVGHEPVEDRQQARVGKETRRFAMHLPGREAECREVYVGVDHFARHHEIQHALAGLESAGRADVDHAADVEIREHQRQRTGGIGLANAGARHHDFLCAVAGLMQDGVEVALAGMLGKEGEQRVALLRHGRHNGNGLMHAKVIAQIRLARTPPGPACAAS